MIFDVNEVSKIKRRLLVHPVLTNTSTPPYPWGFPRSQKSGAERGMWNLTAEFSKKKKIAIFSKI